MTVLIIIVIAVCIALYRAGAVISNMDDGNNDNCEHLI